jgi:hypothetical protein
VAAGVALGPAGVDDRELRQTNATVDNVRLRTRASIGNDSDGADCNPFLDALSFQRVPWGLSKMALPRKAGAAGE